MAILTLCALITLFILGVKEEVGEQDYPLKPCLIGMGEESSFRAELVMVQSHNPHVFLKRYSIFVSHLSPFSLFIPYVMKISKGMYGGKNFCTWAHYGFFQIYAE